MKRIIESFLNIDYFDDSKRDLFLIIDSDKHINELNKQNKRAKKFNKKAKGNSYVLQKRAVGHFLVSGNFRLSIICYITFIC